MHGTFYKLHKKLNSTWRWLLYFRFFEVGPNLIEFENGLRKKFIASGKLGQPTDGGMDFPGFDLKGYTVYSVYACYEPSPIAPFLRKKQKIDIFGKVLLFHYCYYFTIVIDFS